MERRVTADRRREHLFVANDRRSGPFDRRNAAGRQQELEAQRAKIERIQAFKQKDQRTSQAKFLFTMPRLMMMGAAVIVIILVLIFML